MYQITRVGVDLAKNVLQVHAVDSVGKKVVNKPSSANNSSLGAWSSFRLVAQSRLNRPLVLTIGANDCGLWVSQSISLPLI